MKEQEVRKASHKENIIVMGGSFNPPTIAHMKILQTAMDKLQAKKGFFVPVSHPYLKRKMSKYGCSHMCLSDELRLKMLEEMCKEDERMAINTEEMKETFAITYQIMSKTQESYPDANIFFVSGADKLSLIEEFGQKSDFLERFFVILFTRNDTNLEAELEKYEKLSKHRNSLVFLEHPKGIEAVSSTAIRNHLYDIDAVSDMLHPAVLPYLKGLKESDFPKEILQFKKEYDFLDNAYPVPITYEGLVYPSVTSAFYASKSLKKEDRLIFAKCSIEKAKTKGGAIRAYEGWEEKQLEIMEELIRIKFWQNPQLLEKLLDTKGCTLIDGNKKKEKFWGLNLITWEGENYLGKILMKIRDEYTIL